jgi:hypothetical protein
VSNVLDNIIKAPFLFCQQAGEESSCRYRTGIAGFQFVVEAGF